VSSLVLGLKLHVVHAASERDLETAFATCVQLRVGALLTAADPFFYSRREQIVALAARYMQPAIYEWRQDDRPSRRADDYVRVRHQSQDCEGAALRSRRCSPHAPTR
jgi:hypothetical protein